MALLPVSEAINRLLAEAAPSGEELVALREAAGRVSSRVLYSRRTQPPFDASAMDGYAVRVEDLAALPATLSVVGVSAAGHRFKGAVGAGQAVRIFTGAPVPPGADTIVIQENARTQGPGSVQISTGSSAGKHIRRAGLDFQAGDALVGSGERFDAGRLALAASGNHAEVPVYRKPVVALVATGDELKPPGTELNGDQIISSNSFGIAAIVEAPGALVLDLGIVPDEKEAIGAKLDEALALKADVIVTVGGASVGDHDLVHQALIAAGVELSFWKIAMRPGKPLMFGKRASTRFIGLPGNPVASLVCSHVFLKPLIARLAGHTHEPDIRSAMLDVDMPENDERQDYLRASLRREAGRLIARPFPVQDSSMLRFFAEADALIIRPPHAPAAASGSPSDILLMRQ